MDFKDQEVGQGNGRSIAPLLLSHTPFIELSWSPGGRVVSSSLTQADLQQKENINWGKVIHNNHVQTTRETLSRAGRGLRVSPWRRLFMCEVSFYAPAPDEEDTDEMQRTKRGWSPMSKALEHKAQRYQPTLKWLTNLKTVC